MVFRLLIPCLLVTALLRPLPIRAEALSLYEQKIRFEEKIVSQIKEDLKTLIDPETYTLTAVAELKVEKKLLTQQITQQNKPAEAPAQPNEALPGFERAPAAPAAKPKSPTESTTVYEEVTDLASLSLTVLLKPEIPPELETVLTDYLNSHWVTPYPEIVHLTVKRINLPKKEEAQAPAGQEESPELEGLGKILEHPWFLPACALALLFLLLLLIFQRRSSLTADIRIPSQAGSLFTPPEPEAAKKGEPAALNPLKEAFIQELLDNPLVGRRYLTTPPQDTQAALSSLFQNSFIKDFLAQSMGPVKGGHDAELSTSELENLLMELKESKRMREKISQMPFGFLTNLTPTEFLSMIRGEPVENLPYFIRYLEKDHLDALLKHLTPEEQAKLLEKAPSENEAARQALENRLKGKYERFANEILLAKSSQEEIMDFILENSPEGSLLAKNMIAKNPALKDRYQKYTWDLDFFSALDLGSRRRILGELDNEILVKTLHGAEGILKEKVFEAVSRERRRILEGLERSMGRKFEPAELNSARGEVLRQMRLILKEHSSWSSFERS